MTDRKVPGKLFQIGYVVPDIDKALAHMNNVLGIPNFMVMREMIVENGWFRGKSAHINHSMAFGYVGDMNIEVIQPIEGPSTYSEYLDRVPEGGVHHIAYSVDNYDEAEKDLISRGFTKVQQGTFGDTVFGYFESPDDPGTMTEIVYLDPGAIGMFQSIKDQTF